MGFRTETIKSKVKRYMGQSLP